MKSTIIAISLAVIAACGVYALAHQHRVEAQAAFRQHQTEIRQQYEECIDTALANQFKPGHDKDIPACVADAAKAGWVKP